MQMRPNTDQNDQQDYSQKDSRNAKQPVDEGCAHTDEDSALQDQIPRRRRTGESEVESPHPSREDPKQIVMVHWIQREEENSGPRANRPENQESACSDTQRRHRPSTGSLPAWMRAGGQVIGDLVPGVIELFIKFFVATPLALVLAWPLLKQVGNLESLLPWFHAFGLVLLVWELIGLLIHNPVRRLLGDTNR